VIIYEIGPNNFFIGDKVRWFSSEEAKNLRNVFFIGLC
jgi:hypothetical protein